MNSSEGPGRATSTAYRANTADEINNCFESIRLFSENNGISIKEAKEQLLEQGNIDKWSIIPLVDSDAQVNDTFTSDKTPVIVCASLLCNRQQLYNDTIVVGVYEENGQTKFQIVTYSEKRTKYITHSGDINTSYGLQHVISFLPLNQPLKAFVISAPWLNGGSLPVKTLEPTNPILEIRTENTTETHEPKLTRTVIPQDYSDTTYEQTACVNAEIIFDGELWTVTITRNPIKGFASNPKLLTEEINRLISQNM